MIHTTEREPPLLMLNCQINPEWEKWLRRNHPNLPTEVTNANVFVKILHMRATMDIIIKQNWDDYSREAFALLKEHPEYWPLLQTINPPKPTLFQRLLRFFFGGKRK